MKENCRQGDLWASLLTWVFVNGTERLISSAVQQVSVFRPGRDAVCLRRVSLYFLEDL